ncbi:MAG TPA: FAD-binding oxidoreductase [Rhizomicrobium sp.]|jgi:glycine/D-amino acid oxidase-like deaminating enzyme
MPINSESATVEKKLHSGRSVWADSAKAHAHLLKDSIRADVVIVGAGVSGAFMAHALAKRFDNVVVVDRRAPAHGSTMASTAMLQFEIDTPLTELSEKIGPSKAARAWRRSWRATQSIVKLVEGEGVRCGLRRADSLYLAGDSTGSRGLEKEMKARHRAGLPGEYLDAKRLREVFDIDRTGAIFSPGVASANPVALTQGLLRRAIRDGVSLYSPVEITDVLATPHGVILDTGKHFIEAKHAVFCTGYELLKGLPRKGTKITSSWAIASRPHAKLPRWLANTLIWEAADPYLYMRATPDGRLIVGGEDEEIDLPSYRARSIAHKTARLVAKAKKLIPGLEFTLSRQWTGAFGESEDGLPIIDRVPDMPNCIAVMGFGGNGTIYSKIASEIVPTLLRGRPDKDADIFRFR